MKRVRTAPGKFVTISADMAEKVARVFATGLTREQARGLKATEPRFATGLMIGSPRPLALSRRRSTVAKPVGSVSSIDLASSFLDPSDAPAEKT